MIAVIPARGGSRRIPGKNIRPFFGAPMLAYAVAAAANSGLFRVVAVSTDDSEIARVAKEYGAMVVERPEALAGDRASVSDVTVHAAEALGAVEQGDEAVCQLMPNCPLRRGQDIVDLYEAFRRGERAFQISAVPFRGVYPQWTLTVAADGQGSWAFGERLVPSQDFGSIACPTGAVWWASTRALLEQRTFYGSPFHVEMMDANRGMDIDTPEDLELAEVLVMGLTARDDCDPLEPIPAGAEAGHAR